MIDKVLGFLVDELNRYFTQRGPGCEPVAVLSRMDTSGDATASVENKLVLSLLNIGEEKSARLVPGRVAGAFPQAAPPPPLIDLNVILAASFRGDYPEALRVLSAAIGYFEATPIFKPESAPGLPDGITILSIEMVTCDFATLSNIWSMLGANYLPSVIYKIRTPGMGGPSVDLPPQS